MILFFLSTQHIFRQCCISIRTNSRIRTNIHIRIAFEDAQLACESVFFVVQTPSFEVACETGEEEVVAVVAAIVVDTVEGPLLAIAHIVVEQKHTL